MLPFTLPFLILAGLILYNCYMLLLIGRRLDACERHLRIIAKSLGTSLEWQVTNGSAVKDSES